jgi:hypothetical protein
MPIRLSARAAMTPATAVPCSSPAHGRSRADQVGARRDLPFEIGMVELHAAVDHRDARPPGRWRRGAARRDATRSAAGCSVNSGVVVRQRPEHDHRLRPGDARLALSDAATASAPRASGTAIT